MSAGRLTLLAGAGDLVPEVVAAALAGGYRVQVLALTPRPSLAGVRMRSGDLSRPLGVLWAIRWFRTSQIAMAGGIQIGDATRQGLARFFAGRGNARARAPVGDSALSGLATTLKRLTGAELVGLQQIAPALMASEGHIAGPKPSAELHHALAAARAIGRLDIGQAAVTSGRRIIAVEDIGGTDDLIARVGELRRRGVTGDGSTPLVLAKARKPGQPAFVDLPAIGPQTIENAAAAGISHIVVEAGQTLVIGREHIAAAAVRLGVSVSGQALG